MATQTRFVAKNGLDNNSKTITSVADPVNAQDASTKNFSSNADNLTAGTVAAARMPAFTGDATSSAGSTALTLANVVTAGTGIKITFNAKGLVTGSASLAAADIPSLDWSKITSGKPTTLSGYGITDAQTLIAAGTTAQYYRGDKSWATLDKAAVGLGNVENTALSTWAGSSNLTTAGNLTAASLSVTGNLTVNGTTTTVNSTTVTLDDPVITLGGDTAPTTDDNKDRGVEFRWHNGSAAKVGFFGFDDSTGKLTFIPDATNTNEVFSGSKGTIDAYIAWSDVTSKPTTRDGYGITDVPKTDGTGASGSWNISVTGTASSTPQHTVVDRDRTLAATLPNSFGQSVRFDFANASATGTGGNYSGVMTFAPYTGTTASTGDASYQIAFGSTAVNGGGNPQLRIRKGIDTTWNGWVDVLTSVNYNSYSPTLTGTGASGSWGINVTGTAGGLSGGDSTFYGLLYNTSTADLNTFNAPGIVSAEYTGSTNRPVASTGHMFQISDAGGTDVKTQWYFESTGVTPYVRLQWGNGTWKPWQAVLTSSNFSTYATPAAHAGDANIHITAAQNTFLDAFVTGGDVILDANATF
jgi:hypothetical protein